MACSPHFVSSSVITSHISSDSGFAFISETALVFGFFPDLGLIFVGRKPPQIGPPPPLAPNNYRLLGLPGLLSTSKTRRHTNYQFSIDSKGIKCHKRKHVSAVYEAKEQRRLRGRVFPVGA